jgi:hypothetical protein
VLSGERKAGYAVVIHEEVIEARPLPAGDLTLETGKRLNIYTNSKHAFLVLHGHAAIWKESKLLSRRASPIKHEKEILQ